MFHWISKWWRTNDLIHSHDEGERCTPECITHEEFKQRRRDEKILRRMNRDIERDRLQ